MVPLLPFHCQSAGLDGKMKALVIHILAEFEKGEGYKVGGCGGPSFPSTVRVLMWSLW